MKAGKFLAIAMVVALTAATVGCPGTMLRRYGAIVQESGPTVQSYFWSIDEGNHDKYAALLDPEWLKKEPLKEYDFLYKHIWERKTGYEAHFALTHVTFKRGLFYADRELSNVSDLSAAGLCKFEGEKIIQDAKDVSDEPLPDVPDGSTLKIHVDWKLTGTAQSGVLKKKPQEGELTVTFRKVNGTWCVVKESWSD